MSLCLYFTKNNTVQMYNRFQPTNDGSRGPFNVQGGGGGWSCMMSENTNVVHRALCKNTALV